MKNLEQFSTDELEEELRRREEEEKPKQIAAPDLTKLRKICQEYIDSLARDKYVDGDLDHYIFEAAMETVFGKNVWDWINDQE